MKVKRLKQIFENWKLSAVFAVLNTKAVPWAQTVNAAPLDLDYVGNFSGRKIVSNLVESLLGEDDDATLTPADLSMLCDIIVALYGTKWSKLWDTMAFDYNPIENYSMVETMTNDETVTEYGKTHTRTDNLQHQRTDNLQHAKTGTETETPNTRTSEDKSAYGFNSVEAVPTDEREIANTGTNQMTYNTQDADTGTQTEADTGTQTDAHTGTQTEADTGSDTSTRNYRLTRAGNIGVTTSQQMVESERELWRMWDFFRSIVYPDIDRVLTIEIY